MDRWLCAAIYSKNIFLRQLTGMVVYTFKMFFYISNSSRCHEIYDVIDCNNIYVYQRIHIISGQYQLLYIQNISFTNVNCRCVWTKDIKPNTTLQSSHNRCNMKDNSTLKMRALDIAHCRDVCNISHSYFKLDRVNI
jgi:hypothetical protein